MSQKSVEILLGKMVTDEGFRRKFRHGREAALDGEEALGLVLTAIEREALLLLDCEGCERFSRLLDPRIRKLDLTPREDKAW